MPRHFVALAALPLLLLHQTAHAQACTTPGLAIDDKGFVSIGGIEQWVRIKGSSCAAPARPSGAIR